MAAALRYPIAAVARLTGLTLDTIRAWERRYGAVTPERGVRGRVYSESQVQRLRVLAALVAQGHPIGGIANLSDPRLEELLRRTTEGRPLVETEPAAAGPSPIAAVLAAIERFDYAGADREVARLASLYASRDLVYEVALPLMRTVGDRWHAGELSVAQEHMVSAILRAVLAGLVRLHTAPGTVPRLLFATPETELHEFGILVAAMLASAAGLGAVYLGPNVPASDIGDAAARADAAVVVLGVTGGTAAVLDRAIDVRRATRPETEVWVGGNAAGKPRGAAGKGRLVSIPTFEEYERHLHRIGA